MIVINPGSGPVDGRATLDNAWANMEAFVKESKAKSFRRDVEETDDPCDTMIGRFAFLLTTKTGEEISVLMPGLSLDQVRKKIKKCKGQMPPRLYVDGSSWWWEFAVEIIQDWEQE